MMRRKKTRSSAVQGECVVMFTWTALSLYGFTYDSALSGVLDLWLREGSRFALLEYDRFCVKHENSQFQVIALQFYALLAFGPVYPVGQFGISIRTL